MKYIIIIIIIIIIINDELNEYQLLSNVLPHGIYYY
jgi:hypothetical protein